MCSKILQKVQTAGVKEASLFPPPLAPQIDLQGAPCTAANGTVYLFPSEPFFRGPSLPPGKWVPCPNSSFWNTPQLLPRPRLSPSRPLFTQPLPAPPTSLCLNITSSGDHPPSPRQGPAPPISCFPTGIRGLAAESASVLVITRTPPALSS